MPRSSHNAAPTAGKGPAGRVRREGLVPAVVYGLGADNVSVAVSQRELVHILSGGSGMNTLITLEHRRHRGARDRACSSSGTRSRAT